MIKINEREIAVDILSEITQSGSYNNIALKNGLARYNALDPAQKALITELVNGSLRNLIYIDYCLDNISSVPVKKMKPLILNILRIGFYQLAFLDRIPSYAAIHEAVELCKKRGLGKLSGFVNGMLRGAERKEILLPPEEEDPAGFMEIKYSCPRWLAEKLIHDLGAESARMYLERSQKSPEVTICVNRLKTTPGNLMEALAEGGAEASPGTIFPYALKISKTSDISRLKAFREGLFHVMDESAMAAVEIAGIQEGMTVIDLCAAPGGKSFLAAEKAGDRGRILSRDVFSHKLQLIREGTERLGLTSINPQLGDGRVTDHNLAETADVVILDAPCTGLGIMGKKPDIKYNRRPENVKEMAQLQRKIFEGSWRYVKKSGALVYSVCTATREEGMENVEYFMQNYPFRLMEFKWIDRTQKGILHIMPWDYGSDGFFIAKLQRNDEDA